MRRPVCESKYFARLGSEGREHSLVPLLESNSADLRTELLAPSPPVTINTEILYRISKTSTLLTKSELFSFNFRKFYLGPAKNVEMGSRH